jgi:hypothetical protein
MDWKNLLRQALIGIVLGAAAGWALWSLVLRKEPSDVLLTIKVTGKPTQLVRLAVQGDPVKTLELLRGALVPLFTAPANLTGTNDVVLGEYNATVGRKDEKTGQTWFADTGDIRLVLARIGDPPVSVYEFQKKVRNKGWVPGFSAPPGLSQEQMVRHFSERLREELLDLYGGLAASPAR